MLQRQTAREKTKMKHRKIKVKNRYELIDYKFDTLLEMISYVENAKRITAKKSSETGDYSFTGTHSLNEAMTMCKNGYFSKEVENFQKLFFKITNQIDKQLKVTRVKHDFIGGAPDVPRYLIGHPLNMLNVDKKDMGKKPKKIVLRFNTSISCGTSKDYIEKRGLAFVLLFDLLKKLGSPVELQTVEFSKYEDIYTNYEVSLMKNNDIMNISKIYFPLAHPSYLRRIMFALAEKTPELEDHQGYFWGYGQPTSFRRYIELTGEDEHKNEINIFSDDYSYNSLGVALKDIVKDIGAQGGLKTPTQQIIELIDTIDFSPLSTFAPEDDFDYDMD